MPVRPSRKSSWCAQKPASPCRSWKSWKFPLPRRRDFAHAWHGYLAGVGGMGIGVSAATLVRAGHREGYKVVFSDKNGLAIRNGGVYSHITFLQPGCNHVSPIIPYGKADLMLGIDILEAARGLDPKGNLRVGGPRTRAIVNRQKTPTIHTLLGTDDFCVETLEASLRRYTDARAISAPTSRSFPSAFSAPSSTPTSSCSASPSSAASCRSRSTASSTASRKRWAAPPRKTGSRSSSAARSRTRLRPAPRRSRDEGTYHEIVAEKSARLKRSGPQRANGSPSEYWQLVTRAREKLTLDGRHEVAAGPAHLRPDPVREPRLRRDITSNRLVRLHARDAAELRFRRHPGCALEPAPRHGDQGRGLCRLPAEQRGEIRARPRALQGSSRNSATG